jgi:hypothetical protein
MIRVKLKKTGEWLLFDNYEDIVIYLRAKAKLWRAKENDSNDRYKKQVIKRIKRMYGVTYENKNQTDKEFIYNLYRLGEIAELIEVGADLSKGAEVTEYTWPI